MSARDDELTQRYREANAQDDARPGAHVRAAVRAHAQMLAAAAAAPLPTSPASPAPSQAAANQSRWKISALATVAVVGLTGLLLLQFQRGTPEEQEIAYGQRRADSPARAQPPAALPAPAPISAAPSAAPAAAPDSTRDPASPSTRSMAPKPAAPAPGQIRPLAKTAPAPAMREAESPPAPGAVGAVSGFPASPPFPTDQASVLGSGPAAAPSAPRAEIRERSTAQSAPAAKAVAPPPQTAAEPATAEAARSAAPVHAPSAARAARSLQGGNADNAHGVSLPDGLREAARAGRTLQVESFILQGVPIDARDSAGRTALMLAAANGQTATVQKLLALGANPALVDHEGLSAAQQARRLGHIRIAELIEAGS